MAALVAAIACQREPSKELPRGAASAQLDSAFRAYADSVTRSAQNPDPNRQVILHNLMILKDGKVVVEHDFDPEWPAERPQHMFSCSKTFTALAVGLAVDDGLLSVEDSVSRFFPERIKAGNPCRATVRDLLTMQGGHATDPTWDTMAAFDSTSMEIALKPGVDLMDAFLSHPFEKEPGTYFTYNSLSTYMCSAIVQKLTGKTILDYLDERIFQPLGIDKPVWDMDEAGVCTGGWGLHLKLEDMAKVGQLLLQKGAWNGKQLISARWVEEQTRKHIDNYPNGLTAEQLDQPYYPLSRNDWVAGYGYQTWRNTIGGFRADGAWGQMIIVLPEKNAVIAARAQLANHQVELWSFWDLLVPYL